MSYENPVNPHATDATPKRPMNETPLTREKVRAIEMGSPTADANEEPWDIGDLCQSHELLRARLEEAKTDIADLEAGITAQDEVLTARINAEFERAERAERDVADARADWTKQRHRAEKAELERDEALAAIASDGADAVGDNQVLRSDLAAAHARIRVLEDALQGVLPYCHVDSLVAEEALEEARAALSPASDTGTVGTQSAAKFEEFGRWCLERSRDIGGSDIDGGDAQDKAIELGLLHYVTVTEPCHPECRCVEYHGEFPCQCLRDFTDAATVPPAPEGEQ